ncbi:MAG: MlaD family protein [Aeromicrobium sp.]|uniref:MCE family protein n=1 Tax=Aeromicrobium sp. TaxID=1871063 RepID=UPI0039E63DEC
MRLFTYLKNEPRKVGLMGVVGVVLLGLLVLMMSTVSFGKQKVTAYLEHTAGLRTGEEVQVAGVGVGDVTSIELTKDAVKVEFTMDKDIKLGSTTSLAVKVATLLGTHYLDITPSGPGELKDKTIPVERTKVPYNLQDVIEGGHDQLDELDEQKLADAMGVVGEVLGQTPEEAQAAIEGVSALSQAAVARTEQMQALLDASGTFTGQLNGQTDEIMVLLEESSTVLEHLVSRQQAIDSLLVDAQALATQVNGIIGDVSGDLEPLMTNLTASLDHLWEVRNSIMTTLESLSDMTVYLANASGNGPWVDLNVPSLLPDTCTVGAVCE